VEHDLKIFNGRIITPNRIIDGGVVLISNGKIIAVSENNIEAPEAIAIDARGKYISPGFIDIHVHGGAGHDFMDNTVEAFLEIAKIHARHGTTAMLPTTLTSSKADLIETLKVYETSERKNLNGSQFIGMHLEGPYLALAQCGAQDPRYIRDPEPEEYKEIIASSTAIKRWSAAPELQGALEFGNYITSKGILAAIAHTDAVYDEVLTALENGYTLVTHLYSAMSGVTRRNAFRYAGVIESAFLIDELDVEIIADGIHVPPPLLKLVYKIKGPEKIALITDAMRAAGMPPGESILGSLKNGLKVIVEDNVAKLPDRTSFAGSVATMDRAVRTMINAADIPLIEAVRMAATTPAAIMKIENKGSLVSGKDADVLLFDDNIHISMTIIKGKIVYDNRSLA
jgi:N-acetylglucosamine-6-phosphate deacetylase